MYFSEGEALTGTFKNTSVLLKAQYDEESKIFSLIFSQKIKPVDLLSGLKIQNMDLVDRTFNNIKQSVGMCNAVICLLAGGGQQREVSAQTKVGEEEIFPCRL